MASRSGLKEVVKVGDAEGVGEYVVGGKDDGLSLGALGALHTFALEPTGHGTAIGGAGDGILGTEVGRYELWDARWWLLLGCLDTWMVGCFTSRI